jgi:hypothetical protein
MDKSTLVKGLNDDLAHDGDFALVNDLEEIISDETKHKEQTAKMLRGNWATASTAE